MVLASISYDLNHRNTARAAGSRICLREPCRGPAERSLFKPRPAQNLCPRQWSSGEQRRQGRPRNRTPTRPSSTTPPRKPTRPRHARAPRDRRWRPSSDDREGRCHLPQADRCKRAVGPTRAARVIAGRALINPQRSVAAPLGCGTSHFDATAANQLHASLSTTNPGRNDPPMVLQRSHDAAGRSIRWLTGRRRLACGPWAAAIPDKRVQ